MGAVEAERPQSLTPKANVIGCGPQWDSQWDSQSLLESFFLLVSLHAVQDTSAVPGGTGAEGQLEDSPSTGWDTKHSKAKADSWQEPLPALSMPEPSWDINPG